jgi:hypothetical protein
MQAVLYAPSKTLHDLATQHGIDMRGLEVVDTPNDASTCAAIAVADCAAMASLLANT